MNEWKTIQTWTGKELFPDAGNEQKAEATSDQPISFAMTATELELANKVVGRYLPVAHKHGLPNDRLHVLMSICACHCNGCPLDLFSMAHTSDVGKLCSDVALIARLINVNTGRLHHYVPLFASKRARTS
jgi:hypothetical protein